ncbi:hypothetical protein TNCV_4111761 [Trichonephila clavipes]|nr:hypothetical protein TNCV_4111761 [Trichonephila clavipes]
MGGTLSLHYLTTVALWSSLIAGVVKSQVRILMLLKTRHTEGLTEFQSGSNSLCWFDVEVKIGSDDSTIIFVT